MAQTTGAISWKDCKIEISTDNEVWTDISGFANSIEIGGGERATAEFFTTDGETPILTAGKLSPTEITFKVAYTEGVAEPFEVIRQAYEQSTPLYLRWSPMGGQSGQFQFTTSKGTVTNPPYPQGSADTPDVLVTEGALKCSRITKTVVV